jgi:putative FmdB family regulatory protein
MPTYEYQCTACGHAFEKFQSITAEPIKVCPQCSKKKVKRLIGTGAGLIFKGSGFYITDYRSDSYKSAAKSDTGSSAASPSSSSSSSSSSGGSSTPAAPSKPEKSTSAKAAAVPAK